MLTVPEAARRAGRNPETIRRWIREGKLRARKVGTQHVLEEADLAAVLQGSGSGDSMPLPEHWKRGFWGGPMPDWAAIVREQRSEH
jgi:excisionase family DNA binding protein